eukprot:c8028_g1_i1.p1 GENE.c8028_g1_i1~~c8028_g1_i1.p1  ORF type:complete len:370 (-),score=51.70 c8028_g1_i1:438-1517(-)
MGKKVAFLSSLFASADAVSSLILIYLFFTTNDVFWALSSLVIVGVATLVNWMFTLMDHRSGPIKLLFRLIFDIPHFASLVDACAPKPQPESEDHHLIKLSSTKHEAALRVRLFFCCLFHALPKTVLLTYIILLHHSLEDYSRPWLPLIKIFLPVSVLSFILSIFHLCLGFTSRTLVMLVVIVHICAQFALRTFALALFCVVFEHQSLQVIAGMWALALLFAPQGLLGLFCTPYRRCSFLFMSIIVRTFMSWLSFFLVISPKPHHIVGTHSISSAFGASTLPFLLVRLAENLFLVWCATLWDERQAHFARPFPSSFVKPNEAMAFCALTSVLALVSHLSLLLAKNPSHSKNNSNNNVQNI